MIPTNDRPELLAAALAAAARGWHVFPLRPGSKRPAFPDHLAADCTRTDPRCQAAHQGWEPRATLDPDRIRRAWQAAPFNVGIACGPSRLLVVDLDIPKPDDGPAPQAWQLRTRSEITQLLCLRWLRSVLCPWSRSLSSVATTRSGLI